MVYGLISLFHLLHDFKKVTISLLPFLIKPYRIIMNCLVVLFSLICSFLTSEECLHCNPKFMVWSVCVSVLVRFHMVFI
jgi:hypothetical protein